MSALAQYLEAAKVEEVAGELEAAGYTVTRGVRDGNLVYDLVAARDGRKIAIEVQAQSALRESVGKIRELRAWAREHGYDEFRLVVVNPPRERIVAIPALKEALCTYLSDNFPAALDGLSSHTSLNRVSGVDVASVEITEAGSHVTGSGVAEVMLQYGGGTPSDGVSGEADVPFSFDLLLDPQLRIAEVYALEVDTSEFHE
ncbi:MAG TPA: hypothetical protein VFW96_26835 [Thermomicrobiales bacterium]|nr:hypothetical protein [Thermomicrobiales bacterium]